MVGIDLLAPGRGTVFSGSVALKICPNFVRYFSGLEPQKIVFITGTNGKSSTTNVLVRVLKRWGKSVAANLAGANMLSGVAVALMRESSPLGRMRAEYVVLEVDERFLPLIAQAFPYPPRILCVTNLQKDQVQRNGDPSVIYRKMASAINPATTLVLNNDEPISASLVDFSARTHYYGVDRNTKSIRLTSPYTVTMPCVHCGGGIEFDYCNIPNVGRFRCTQCSYASRQGINSGRGSLKQPQTIITDIDWRAKNFVCNKKTYTFTYSAAFFMYCYAAVLAMSEELSIPAEAVQQELAEFVAPAGRMEILNLHGKEVKYIRFKQENPDTLQSALDTISADQRQKIVLLGYNEIEDFHPHYTNTFYTYDCDFDALEKSGVYRYVCFSQAVCYDAAIRLIYAGVDKNRIIVVPSADIRDAWGKVQSLPCANIYLVTWLHAFEELARGIQHTNKAFDVGDCVDRADLGKENGVIGDGDMAVSQEIFSAGSKGADADECE